MGNIICDNYYCQSVSFKPEWFSESSWNIDYKYDLNEKDDINKKPYHIDKGIIKINNVSSFDLLLSKKLLIDFDEIKNISIPINFKYNIEKKNEYNINIIFSNKLLLLNDINNLDTNNTDIFFINLKIFKKYCFIYRSFNDIIIKKKLNTNKINTFLINLENNINILLVSETLYNNNKINIYENKYLKNNFNYQNNFFLNILIKSKNNICDNEFIELNFE
jgi:hypothetical protein